MFPELFRIPRLDIPIPSYGLLLTIGFILALWLTAHLAGIDGLPKGRVYDLAMYMIPSALLGTRLLMISTSEHRVWSFDLLNSVGHYLGGLLTGLLVSPILMRVWRLPWRKTADAFAPGLALGNILGRIGCFLAGCCWGKPTSSWLGVTFGRRAHEITNVPINDALLPTQLIEAGANLTIFLFLLWLWKRKAFDGQIILVYLMLYSLERFTVEFWRDDPRGEILSLSTAQFISVIMFPIAMALYCWLLNKTVPKPDAS